MVKTLVVDKVFHVRMTTTITMLGDWPQEAVDVMQEEVVVVDDDGVLGIKSGWEVADVKEVKTLATIGGLGHD